MTIFLPFLKLTHLSSFLTGGCCSSEQKIDPKHTHSLCTLELHLHVHSILFSGLCGILFPNKRESAFASLRMYESIGFTISAAYAQFLCMDVKMYITGSVLLVSVIGYFVMESIHEQEKRLKKKPVSFV